MTARVGWGPRLTTAALRVLPQHALGRLMYTLARCQWRPIRRLLIGFVIRRYGIDTSEALEPDPAAYPSFNAFFTRALRPGARPPATDPDIVLSPADGTVSQIGDIVDGSLVQAKGFTYELRTLLAGDADLAAPFAAGRFATIYLSPRDYHRVHMPCAGRLRRMDFVPGSLFSVSDATTRLVPDLFARNERLICHFDGDFGPFAVILVGAIFVGSMETVWAGEIRPGGGRPKTWHYDAGVVDLARGDEMGRFNMGSTVILLFPPDTLAWTSSLQAGARVRMGQALGTRLVAA